MNKNRSGAALLRAPHRLLLAALLGSAPVSVWAQAAQAPPAAPAAPTREELELQQGLARPLPPSRLSVDGGFEHGTCALGDPALANVRVTFGKVTFANLPGVSAAELDSTWADLAGTEQPVAVLCEVRDRAATILRKAGFLAAVQVPPQRIERGGEVRMDVLAAKLVDVQVRGRPGNAESQIAAHLRQLTSRPWFNVHEAERQLLLLRDLPGFDVRLTLRPANAGPGEVIGDVVVKRRPVELVVGGQNLASGITGREGAIAQLTLNDLTGMGDRTVLSLYNTLQTSEQTVAQISHEFALGPQGLRLGGQLVYGHARPDFAGNAFSTSTWIGGLHLAYPFVRRQAWTLAGTAGIDVVDQKIDFGGARLSADKLRVVYGRLEYRSVDGASLAGRSGYSVAEPKFRIGGAIEVRKGLNWLGASQSCVVLANCLVANTPISNIAANPQAALVRGEANLEYRPIRAVTFVLRPRAQYSGSQLLSFEQFTLGNYTVGRGYDPGTVQGDSGLGAALELRFGGLMPRSASGIAFQPYVFGDAGWAWANDGGLTPERHLVSAGGGVRTRWGDHGDFNLFLAVPLEAAPGRTTLGPARLLLTFSTRLIPWNTQ
ncbi:MAG: ShlB/FhaC/HecB family hemolysin secretion/activation protein [Alphaproteobacteria bacterium]|nr:ShlB/FhaC/HecB family hemolysin secretion/activation protein [Alphaproteobacteria bacterium]